MLRKNLFIYLSAILFYQCSNERDSKENAHILKQNADSVKIMINKYALPAEEELKTEFPFLDSARVRFVRTRDTRYLDSIQRISVKSDAILSPNVNDVLAYLFEVDAKRVIIYIMKNKNLRKRLIQVWAEDLCVYEGKELEEELKAFKSHAAELGKAQGLSTKEMSYLIKMLDEISPTLDKYNNGTLEEEDNTN